MVTVVELLSHPVFKGFSLVTDRSGIYNHVRDTGIFEWENEEMVKSTFHQGSFVLTTLAVYKDDPEQAMKMTRLLISRRLSALCIKRIYFDTLPQEVIDMANHMHVPVLFFSDTYFPDLIFTIRSALTPSEINSSQLRIIRKILYENPGKLETELLVKDINPLFQNNMLCAFANVKDREHASSILDKHESSYRHSIELLSVDSNVVWSRIFMSTGILLIYSDNRSDADLQNGVLKVIRMIDDDLDDFAIGISDVHTSPSEMGIMIKESVYASVDSQISCLPMESFDRIGISQIICPLCNEYWFNRYYDSMMGKIRKYDEQHNSSLFRTVYEYVRCDGDAYETADRMFQHVNTIRYRLNKAYSVFGISEARGKKSQLFILVTLHEIKKILNGTMI